MPTIDPAHHALVMGPTGRQLDRQLTPLVRGVMRTHRLPGLAVGVVADRQVVYARGFGVSSTRTREPVTPRTVFHMASISKPFVATAIMQLVEQGQVELDAPLVTYLPTFRLDDERYREITVRQVLSHTSGMPDVKDYEWHHPQYDDGALERYVRSLTSHKLLFAPGERHEYSNMAYECLGALIARVSGMTFDDYVQSHLLDPLGMVDSTFLKPPHLPANWATPHARMLTDRAWDGYPYNRAHGPSSTLHSNVLDMCRWAIANLNRGHLDGRQILRPSSYQQLWKPHAEVGASGQIGLSWFLYSLRGARVVWHGGGDTGFETHFSMLTESGGAVVLLCNTIPALTGALEDAVLDLLLGVQPPPILPPAMLAVRRTLRRAGAEAAAAQWQALKAEHPDEYTWASPSALLYNAVSLDRVRDATLLARWCARILDEAHMEDLEKSLDGYGNRAASVALTVIRGHRQGIQPAGGH